MDFVGRGQNKLLVCYLENGVACNGCLQQFHSCLLLFVLSFWVLRDFCLDLHFLID